MKIKLRNILSGKERKKRKNIKSSKGKAQVTYKGNPIHLTADLSEETLQARREWQDTFKVIIVIYFPIFS